MRWYQTFTVLSAVAVCGTGCASFSGEHPHHTYRGKHLTKHLSGCSSCQAAGDDSKTCHYDSEQKTLFNWAICKDDDTPKTDSNRDNAGPERGNGLMLDRSNGVKPVAHQEPLAPLDRIVLAADTPPADAEVTRGMAKILTGNGNGSDEKKKDDDWIVTDRPDFTESSSTVGKGRIQIESGYTFTRDSSGGIVTNIHSYPEIHVRLGMFAEWFEWRIDQNFNSLRVTDKNALGRAALLQSVSGATDFTLAAKFALTEQKGILPESAFFIQSIIPSGHPEFTAGKFLPGFSYLFSWELSDKYSLAGSFLGNAAVDDDRHTYAQFANSLSLGVQWTDRFGGYFEHFALYPAGATSPGFTPQYYLDGGFTYKVNRDMQLDIRAGVGLNKAANDYFVGSGFAVRF